MAKSISDSNRYRKKSTGRGRPRTISVSVLVRLTEEEVTYLDAWIVEQERNVGIKLSRGAAIRARLNALKPKGKGQ